MYVDIRPLNLLLQMERFCFCFALFQVHIQMLLQGWVMAMRLSQHPVEGMKGELPNDIIKNL